MRREGQEGEEIEVYGGGGGGNRRHVSTEERRMEKSREGVAKVLKIKELTVPPLAKGVWLVLI